MLGEMEKRKRRSRRPKRMSMDVVRKDTKVVGVTEDAGDGEMEMNN